LWLCGDPVRLRLIGYDFTEVSSEALVTIRPTGSWATAKTTPLR